MASFPGPPKVVAGRGNAHKGVKMASIADVRTPRCVGLHGLECSIPQKFAQFSNLGHTGTVNTGKSWRFHDRKCSSQVT